MEKVFHPYHIVTMSPWPLLVGFSVLSFVVGLLKMIIYMEYNLLWMSMILVILIIFGWWRDVIRESTFQGYHSSNVLSGLMIGMILFILSEFFFFFCFFWAFFHSSLSPVLELGSIWPPKSVMMFNPFQVPLLNTVILLASGVTITCSHQCILNEDWWKAISFMMITWMLGVYFLFLQGFEYYMAGFSISDSVFGSSFFMATGFHGFHVIVGSIFLFVEWVRLINKHFSSAHHFGFECAAWYWHFVDVVWLFLFSVVYWWGT